MSSSIKFFEQLRLCEEKIRKEEIRHSEKVSKYPFCMSYEDLLRYYGVNQKDLEESVPTWSEEDLEIARLIGDIDKKSS